MGESDFKFYRYDPTLVGAIAFIVLFIATTTLHCYQLLRTRSWIMTPLIVGGFFQFIGYIGRALSSQQSPNWTLGPYIIQSLLLLVAPALFAASVYMALGRIILLVDGESHALIKKRWLTKIFVCGDILSFVLQGAGGGIQASGSLSALSTGAHIITGGLFVQVLFFGVFIVVAVHFDLAIRKMPTVQSRSPSIPWRKHLITLYLASLLIMVRSIFRIVEYLQGFDGYILSHEVFLYVFDSVLMLCTMVLFNVVHPSEIVALMTGGNAAKNGWQMKRIDGHHQRIESEGSTSGFA